MPDGYAHGEAFMHMKYRTDDGRVVEEVWNSRDGVTPFVISIEGRQATHIDWQRDRRDPLYIPSVGERIFITLCRKRMEDLAWKKVDLFWDHPEYPMSGRFASKQEAFDLLMTDLTTPHIPQSIIESQGIDMETYEHDPGPDLVVVDDSLHKFFTDRVEAYEKFGEYVLVNQPILNDGGVWVNKAKLTSVPPGPVKPPRVEGDNPQG